MPVVNDEGRLLGIVTVDDALDVLEEEHAEDLRVAGGSADGEDSGHASTLIWLVRRNAWVALWALGVVALALAVGGRLTLAETLTIAIPLAVALVLADDSISYVTNFFLENDPDDEDTPSMLGFTCKGVGIGAALAALLALIVVALTSVLLSPAVPTAGAFEGGLGDALVTGGFAAAASTFVSFALSPVYLGVLRRRDDANKETSGFTLSVVAMLVGATVFVAAALLLAGPGGMVGAGL